MNVRNNSKKKIFYQILKADRIIYTALFILNNNNMFHDILFVPLDKNNDRI